MADRMTKGRLDQIGWMDWAEKTPAETSTVVLELINEIKDLNADLRDLQAAAKATTAPEDVCMAREVNR